MFAYTICDPDVPPVFRNVPDTVTELPATGDEGFIPIAVSNVNVAGVGVTAIVRFPQDTIF